MIDVSVNSSQHNGSASTTLVKTGGRIAVLDRGSTGCGNTLSSSSDTVELDLRRLPCVSALDKGEVNLEAMEPRWRTDAALGL